MGRRGRAGAPLKRVKVAMKPMSETEPSVRKRSSIPSPSADTTSADRPYEPLSLPGKSTPFPFPWLTNSKSTCQLRRVCPG